MGGLSDGIVAIVGGLIGLAIVAVIVGTHAQTSNVLTAAGGALSGVIGAAVQPVSGTSNLYGAASAIPGVFH